MFLLQPQSSSKLHPLPSKTGYGPVSFEAISILRSSSSPPDKRLTFNNATAQPVHQTRPTGESALSGPPPPNTTSRTTSLAVSYTGLQAQRPSSSGSTASTGRRIDLWISSRGQESFDDVGSQAGTETRWGLDPRGGNTIARYPLPRNSPDQRGRGGYITCWDLGCGKGDHEGVSSIHCRPNLTVSWQARRAEREMVVWMGVGWQRWARRSAGVRGRWGMFAARELCLQDVSLDEISVSFLGFSRPIGVLEMKLITRMSLLVCLFPRDGSIWVAGDISQPA